MRTPRTLERLEKLLGRLENMSPAGSLDDALARITPIVQSVTPEWTIPSLAHPLNKKSPCGRYRIMLLAHVLKINPNGAFSIEDLQHPQDVVVTKCSATGHQYVEPAAWNKV